jgi:hypothetical protein
MVMSRWLAHRKEGMTRRAQTVSRVCMPSKIVTVLPKQVSTLALHTVLRFLILGAYVFPRLQTMSHNLPRECKNKASSLNQGLLKDLRKGE